MIEYSVNDRWAEVKVSIEVEEYNEALKKAQEFVIKNMKKGIIFESEDDEYESNFMDLQSAINSARTEDLEYFVKEGIIPFEDGYIRFI